MDNKTEAKMETKKFILSLFMIFVIGAMNSYTYFLRGEVFASMHTGNIIKACFDIAAGKFATLYRYFIPIIAFIAGIITHQLVKKAKRGTLICTLIIPVCYISGVLIPFGALDFLAITVLSFGVGVQLQIVRRVNGVDLATTMCTGNIRSMSEKIAKLIETKDKSLLLGIITYLSLVIVFATGVLVSALLINNLA